MNGVYKSPSFDDDIYIVSCYLKICQILKKHNFFIVQNNINIEMKVIK